MQKIYLIRHGETPWTLSGQHTGITDIDLTPKGEEQSKALGKQLQGHAFTQILCSPLKRARHTCTLSHLAAPLSIEPDLHEWNYGRYEGLTTAEIRKQDPDWTVFTHPVPEGESIAEMSARADRVIGKVTSMTGDVALFSHGHFLRVLAARWLGLAAREGRVLALSPASVSILGYERETRVLTLWNAVLPCLY